MVGHRRPLPDGDLLRRGISETAEGLKAASIRPPLIPSLVADWLPIIQTFGIVGMTNAAYYLTFTYAVERRKSMMGVGGEAFLLATILSLMVVLISKPLSGWLSDRVGRRKLMLALTVATMAFIYVALQMMLYGSPQQFMLGQILLAVPIGNTRGKSHAAGRSLSRTERTTDADVSARWGFGLKSRKWARTTGLLI